mgnify:FL=1
MKKALIVYGGWPGHQPEKCNEILTEMLEPDGYEIRSEYSTAAFAQDYVHEMDLIIPIVTMAFHHSPSGEIKKNEVNNVVKAVVNGCGLAGHHGGMCDAFRQSIDWQFLTGGQWVSHPNGIHDYKVNITKRNDPIMEGIEDFDYHSEQYYMHVDPMNEVLATTTFQGHEIWKLEQEPGKPGDDQYQTEWIKGVEMPVVWKRKIGKGKIFYTSLGHFADELNHPEMKKIYHRGLLWASR